MTRAEDKAPPIGSLNGRMLMAAVVSAISGLLYGYDTGVISGGLLQIAKEFHIGNTMKEVIAAAILLGAVVGSLACSLLSERVGRHRTILMICVVFVLGSLASSLAPTAVALALARVLLGFAVGGATQTVPMYVAELAPKSIRGRLGSASSSPSVSASSSRRSWVRARRSPGGRRLAQPPHRRW